MKFNKGIRKLGSADDGSSFLDQFRLLITEIGNALGFVRIVRLGVMHYCTNAAKFVPSLTEPTSNFATYAEEDGCPMRLLTLRSRLMHSWSCCATRARRARTFSRCWSTSSPVS